jgi:hypothetical protein
METPRARQTLRVFGFPPDRVHGAWGTTTVQGRVGNGRLQLESQLDGGLRIQPGFSGGPVIDEETGRVAGIISEAQPTTATARDCYAITADQLRLTCPEQLGTHPGRGPDGMRTELTILHVSDTRFGGQYLFGGNGNVPAGEASSVLFGQLHRDLEALADSKGRSPQAFWNP